MIVFGFRTDWHDSTLETKRDGSLVERHVGALERVGQEVGVFRGVGIRVREPNGDDMALGEEVWFLQSGLDGFVEREGGGIQGRSKASEMSSAAGDVQVVRQRDAMAGSDLQHFMLAIAVERRPLDARRSVGGVC